MRSPQLTATMLEGTVRLSDQWHGSVKESTQGNQSLVCARGEEERGEEEGIGKQGDEVMGGG